MLKSGSSPAERGHLGKVIFGIFRHHGVHAEERRRSKDLLILTRAPRLSVSYKLRPVAVDQAERGWRVYDNKYER
jgi:hypothetical protein